MKICIFCFSDAGAKLAARLCGALELNRENVHTLAKFAGAYGFTAHDSVKADMETLFARHEALIFIGAAGIAVREIAPYVKSKTEDPAVLVLDERGRFVIPILSGHIGGANALARRVAALIGATPVITTATDVNGKFACDAWAAEHDCAISSMPLAKEVSTVILTREIPVASEFSLPEKLPEGLIRDNSGVLGIYIGTHTKEPFTKTLRLIPRIVTLGVGCRRGTPEETVFTAITEVLEQHEIDIRAVHRIASIDVKQDEQGLLACAKRLGVPAVFFSAEELNAVPGDFEESEFVRQTVGVGNVCERAAVCAGGKLLARKIALNSVTVAAAIEDWSVVF